MMASMVFYGLGMNSGNLGGNIYVNFFLQSLAEVIGFAGCIAMLHKMGRKPVYIASIELSGVACLASFIPVICLGPGIFFSKNQITDNCLLGVFQVVIFSL